MPVSPVSACGEAAAGNIRRPIVANAACGFAVTRTAMPGFTCRCDVGGAEHGGGVERLGKAGVAPAFDIDEHALAALGRGGDAADLDAGMA